jgi:hypothetical protein
MGRRQGLSLASLRPTISAQEIHMRGIPYTKASRPSSTQVPSNAYIAEALAIQASKRPPRSPPKAMPITPTLPKVGKGRRRRRKV